MEDRIFAGATENCKVGVINDAYPGTEAPEPKSLMEKTFHLEPVEMRIKLDISHLGIAQIQAARDDRHNLVTNP